MRVPLWVWIIVLGAAAIAGASSASAAEVYYMHGTEPLGNLDDALTLDSIEPAGPEPKIGHIGFDSDVMTLHFTGPDVQLDDATVTAKWTLFIGPVNQAAWLCCWDPAVQVRLYVDGNLVGNSGQWVQSNPDPILPYVEYEYAFTGIDGSGELELELQGYWEEESDLFVLYDSPEFPSSVTVEQADAEEELEPEPEEEEVAWPPAPPAFPPAQGPTTWYFSSDTPIGKADLAATGGPFLVDQEPTNPYPSIDYGSGTLDGTNPETYYDMKWESTDAFAVQGDVDLSFWAFADGDLALGQQWVFQLYKGDGSSGGWALVADSGNFEYGASLGGIREFTYTFPGINEPNPSKWLVHIDDASYVDAGAAPIVLYGSPDFPSHIDVPGINSAPHLHLEADSLTGLAPEETRFWLFGADEGEYTFTFDADGDGEPEMEGSTLPAGGLEVVHTYGVGGKYAPTLVAVDEHGLSSTVSLDIRIDNPFAVDGGGPHLIGPNEQLLLRPIFSGGVESASVECAWSGDVAPLADPTACSTAFRSLQEGSFSLVLTATRGAEVVATDVYVDVIDTSDPDVDGDGHLNGSDNCPNQANAPQDDHDEDGRGDACDTDDDNDTVLDAVDNCPLLANIGQLDTDHDGIGDVCDDDDDGDAVQDTSDNCPLHANANQQDLDGDGKGDACDADRDGDGRADAFDAFPDDSSEWSDTDHDGVGDNADTDDDGDGILDEDEVETGFDDSDFASRPEGELPEDTSDAPTEDSPGLGSLMVLALVGAAFVLRRR